MNPTVAPIADIMANLDSSQWKLVRDAVERIGALLASGLDVESHAEIARKLAELVAHEKWEVRRAVATALQHVRHHSFETLLARLLVDHHADVQAAAKRTLVLRAMNVPIRELTFA